MNKKIIYFILTFVILVIFSFFITTFILEESSGSVLITIERIEMPEGIKYIKVDNQFLNEFELKDVFLYADSLVPSNLTTGTIDTHLTNATVVTMDNSMKEKLELFLTESNSGKPSKDDFYYLEYETKFYMIGIVYCDSRCQHFIEERLLEQ